jgi:hypothetical protein
MKVDDKKLVIREILIFESLNYDERTVKWSNEQISLIKVKYQRKYQIQKAAQPFSNGSGHISVVN